MLHAFHAMYNGIGLTTPRGSGTSGHVVRNASALRPGQEDGSLRQQRDRDRDRAPRTRPVDQGIVEHNRRRQVEVKCAELQDELEAQGYAEGDVEDRVDTFRKQLLQSLDYLDLSGGRQIKHFETQRAAVAKSRENQRLASALRVEDDYAEGAAFDRELQELKRQKRMLEREREQARETRGTDRAYRRQHRHGKDRQSESGDSDNMPPNPGPDSNVRLVEDGEPGEIEEPEPAQHEGDAASAAVSATTSQSDGAAGGGVDGHCCETDE
ncbi:RNA-splicing factor [Coemansia biformis]|uniref:RNA-splicing factor n=1 Tax=Coemansia biformis TaxID=1286918 RepID=A0A9W8CXT2_9FUNG|nr:RNA-splicing factor [Coemansia biformis]